MDNDLFSLVVIIGLFAAFGLVMLFFAFRLYIIQRPRSGGALWGEGSGDFMPGGFHGLGCGNVGTEGGLAIYVRDEGTGIPGGEQAQIFNKFYRGSEAKARGVKGTGLGLAMVRHIVEGHGGEIRVESEPGRGSTFTLILPGGEPA